MLVHKPQARDTFIQEHQSNLENLARKLLGVPEGSRETEFFRDSVVQIRHWEKCLIAAGIKFEKYFTTQSIFSLSQHPPDYTVTDGSLFWSWPKLDLAQFSLIQAILSMQDLLRPWLRVWRSCTGSSSSGTVSYWFNCQ